MLDQLADLIERYIPRRDELVREQNQLGSHGNRQSAQARERQTAISYELQECKRALDSAVKGQALLRKRIAENRQVDLRIGRQLHQGAVIVAGDQQHRIRQDQRGPLRITASATGELLYQQGSAKPQPLAAIAEVHSDAAETMLAAS